MDTLLEWNMIKKQESSATIEVIEAKGCPLPLPPRSTTNPSTRHENGLAMPKHVLSNDKVDKLHQNVPSVLLLTQGGCNEQIRAHGIMNINIGHGRQKLIGAATRMLAYIEYPRTLKANTTIHKVPSSL